MLLSGEALLKTWERWRRLPGGRWLFSRLIGHLVPYSGSIGARVRQLEPGYAQLTLRDRRRVRQHLGSVHAVALLNLGELTSGLAVLGGLPPGLRAIVTRLSAEYFQKARGLLTSDARVRVSATLLQDVQSGPAELPVFAEIRDADGAVVCRVSAEWRVDRQRPPA